MNKLNFCSTNEFKKCLMLFHFIQTKGNGCPHPNEGEESSTTRRGEGREAPQPTWGGVVLSSLFGVMLPFFSLLWVGLLSPLFCWVVLLGFLLLWVLLFFSPFWSCCLPSLLLGSGAFSPAPFGLVLFFLGTQHYPRGREGRQHFSLSSSF